MKEAEYILKIYLDTEFQDATWIGVTFTFTVQTATVFVVFVLGS
jgi:hypothetical protein